jgi:hypothetical protein
MGVQLIGQAVMRTRAKGGDFVRIAAPPQAAPFLSACGFTPCGTSGDGRGAWEKDIRFPEL